MRRGVFSIRIQRKEEKEFYYSFVIIVDRSTSTSCILLITIFSLSVGIYMRICIERERRGRDFIIDRTRRKKIELVSAMFDGLSMAIAAP
jgi:hypothetical protein